MAVFLLQIEAKRPKATTKVPVPFVVVGYQKVSDVGGCRAAAREKKCRPASLSLSGALFVGDTETTTSSV